MPFTREILKSVLVKLSDPEPIAHCVSGICKGDSVGVREAVGTGENWVRVLQLFSNGTANVQGFRTGEVSTYRISRLTKQEQAPQAEESHLRFGDDSLKNYGGSNCRGVDTGGNVPCSFNFDDEMNATPRWRCCCR